MSWLSKNLGIAKKWKPGRYLESRAKRAFTVPQAWKQWNPFEDRGLGLGKLVGGLWNADTRGGRLQSLGDFADTNPFLGGDINLVNKERRWDALDSIENPSNEQLLELFTGTFSDISTSLKSLGIDDVNMDLTKIIHDNKNQFIKLLNDKLKKGAFNIESSYKNITDKMESERRMPTSYGQEEDLYDSFAKIDTQFGGTQRQATADVLNEILASIGQEGQV